MVSFSSADEQVCLCLVGHTAPHWVKVHVMMSCRVLPSRSIWPHIQCGCCWGRTAPSRPKWCSSARSSLLAAHWSAMVLRCGEKRDECGDYSLIQYEHNGLMRLLKDIRNSLCSPVFPLFTWSCTVQAKVEGKVDTYSGSEQRAAMTYSRGGEGMWCEAIKGHMMNELSMQPSIRPTTSSQLRGGMLLTFLRESVCLSLIKRLGRHAGPHIRSIQIWIDWQVCIDGGLTDGDALNPGWPSFLRVPQLNRTPNFFWLNLGDAAAEMMLTHFSSCIDLDGERNRRWIIRAELFTNFDAACNGTDSPKQTISLLRIEQFFCFSDNKWQAAHTMIISKHHPLLLKC